MPGRSPPSVSPRRVYSAEINPWLVSVERDFWRPILQQAIDIGEVRADRDVDEMIDWILFQQFALGTHGESFGLTEPAIRELVSTYIARSLQPL